MSLSCLFLSLLHSVFVLSSFLLVLSILFYLSCGVLSSASKTILLAPTRRHGWDAGDAGCIVSIGIKGHSVAALLCDSEGRGVRAHLWGVFWKYKS